jgi:hypothetical protein
MRPGFTIRLSEPPACSVFDPQPNAPESTIFRSPTTLFSARRVSAKNDLQQVCILPEPETRNGLSLARNDAFAPLRGQCSRPVPSLPRRRSFANPFDQSSPLGSVSKPNRAKSSQLTRRLRRSPTLLRWHRSPLPFRLFPTFRIKAFNRLHPNKLALPDVRLSVAPRGGLFRFRLGSLLKTPVSSSPAIVP